MSDTKSQENQQELFSDFVPEPQRSERIPSIAKTHKPILISTTLEQILLASVVMILFFCLVFFLGVLRGRALNTAGFIAKSVVSAPATPVKQASTASVPISAATARPAPIHGAINKDGSFMVIKESAAKPYTIQVLTTKKKGYAESESESLKSRGINSWVMQSNEYFVVCVGSYANKEEAKKDLAYFAPKYKGSYLRRR